MYVSPTMTGEGAAFVYNGYNEWCNPYELSITLNGELKTTDHQVVTSLNVAEKIDLEGFKRDLSRMQASRLIVNNAVEK